MSILIFSMWWENETSHNFPYDEIAELCQKYSKGRVKSGKRDANSKVTKSTTGSITRAKLENLFENFKIDILSTLGTQVDVLKAKKKQDEQDQVLLNFVLNVGRNIH